MIIKNQIQHHGYTAITEEDGRYSEMLLDFGLLKLMAGETWSCQEAKERAFMLLSGRVAFQWDREEVQAERNSCFSENPVTLHVPKKLPVRIRALTDVELCVEKKRNPTMFAPKLYAKEEVRCDIFGSGVLNDTTMRTVRTVFDGEIAPSSNMVLGEVINHPGRWSSYPPHHHPQPEIYHYRHFPEQGYGISLLDETPHFIENGDTCLILPNKTHAQIAGAGYAMYYIWMIPHLPENRWLPTTRYCAEKHQWLQDKDVKIWPELEHRTGGQQ